MKLAYISFEHPKGILAGGIGTYVGQITKLMASRGHEVEVFSAAPRDVSRVTTHVHDNYQLHLIPTTDKQSFPHDVIGFFSERNELIKFELIESPDYGADALEVKKKFPGIPVTLKLHTPSFLTAMLNDEKTGIKEKLRFVLGGILRGKLVKPFWIYEKTRDPEFELYDLAESVSSPSVSLGKITQGKWGAKIITTLPYPFIASDKILSLPPKKASEKIIVTFIGRLERRKGILELMKAIPIILKNNKNIEFHFVGPPQKSPHEGVPMDKYMQDQLRGFESKLKFWGGQTYDQIPKFLSDTDICIFPSIWENFPNVCLEALSSARAVIGSKEGGMADMITSGVNGILISPAPRAIAEAILELCKTPAKITQLGIAGRKRVLEAYNAETIGSRTEAFYMDTINKSRAN